jgi:hypothetical protein
VATLVCVRIDWDRTAIPLKLANFHTVRIGPEPEWPFGRKGAALAGAWRQLAGRDVDGMLILDGDVAVDLLDVAAMRASIHVEPDAVHIAPVRLWPASFKSESWVWGHWNRDPGQDITGPWRRFSFCFTYLPRRLIDASLKAGLESWSFPHVDERVSNTAERENIPVRLVEGCSPKHLHF